MRELLLTALILGFGFPVPQERAAFAFRIAGRVVREGPSVSFDRNQRNVQLTGPLGFPARTVQIGADWTFEFLNVPPGSYELRVGPVAMRPAVPVVIARGDKTDLELIIPFSVNLPVTWEYDGGSQSHGEPYPYADIVTFSNIKSGEEAPYLGMTISDSNTQPNEFFSVLLTEGEYRVTVWPGGEAPGLPKGYFVKSMVSGSTDLLKETLKVSTAGTPKPIVITVGVSSPPPWVKVKGRLTGQIPSGALVALTVSSTRVIGAWQSPVSSDGSFEFSNVFAGNYTVRVLPISSFVPAVPITVGTTDVTGIEVASGK